MVLVDVHSKNVDVAGMQAVVNERGKGAVKSERDASTMLVPSMAGYRGQVPL